MREDVPAAKLRPLVKELSDRCGTVKKAATYAGVSHVTLYNILNGSRRKDGEQVSHKMVYQSTARLIILALYQRRKEDRRNGASEAFLRARRLQAQREERLIRLTGY